MPHTAASDPERAERALLLNVIDSSTLERLRDTLRDVIDKSPEAFKLACDRLLVQQGELKKVADPAVQRENVVVRYEGSEEEDELDEGSSADDNSDYSDDPQGETEPAPQGQKRKREYTRQRYEICDQCGEEYDVLANERCSCVWHEGELEVDYDADIWADHDENCHGTIDTDDMREEIPEGFVWGCCEQLGTAKGCRKSVHRPDRAKRVRAWGGR
ncbi:hypothetical protein BU26DRAFT_422577 [Trematosphaeria pertusa]|uniref:Uncharacterized protein n=1 Tax=Trematosphaeria pertusa TaxID=390896 RepID=A0A6A6IMZ6_9PLEO|nr:uncharacterized protein BU26DRAFT_422577 [Trematosphaeria pertusa]KAF2251766.1 hypothetical protein BU26DRAFT_422577 [Trematosphaeria pertusa]